MNLRMRHYVLSLAAIGLLVGLTTGNAPAWNFAPPNSVSGEAFGISVNAAGVAVGPTPHVVLPPDGGMVRDQLLGIAVPNLAASTTLGVVTTGSIGPNKASAQSSATVEQANLLNGVVRAEAVVAMSSSTADGSTATSTGEGSTLIGLSISGSPPVDVTPSANTQIAIPGGTVTLNEQIFEGDGVHTRALTVNMIHVVLKDPLGTITADIIVSSAHSDVNFVPAPKAGNAFMTGGGKLGTGRYIATFGFNAGSRGAGGLHGQLEYIDHLQNLKVHSQSIDSFDLKAGTTTCVTFSGSARVNDVDGYGFTVNSACDNGTPGVGLDSLEISVTGPGLSYGRSGTLTGGNLQLHPE